MFDLSKIIRMMEQNSKQVDKLTEAVVVLTAAIEKQNKLLENKSK